MMKRYLGIGLCLLILLTAATPAFAQSGNPPMLDVSYVKFSAAEGGAPLTSFPAANTKVFASAHITNHGTTPQAVVLWVGRYKNNALIDIEYQRRVIPPRVTYTFTSPALVLPEGTTSENTEVKAYIWDNFTGANAVAASASMLRDSGDLRYINIDGKLLEGFSNGKTGYTYTVPSDVSKRPGITAAAKDNATKVEISDYTVPGQTDIKVTKGDGTVKTFTVQMKYGHGNISDLKNKLGTQTYRAFHNLSPLSLFALQDVFTAEQTGWENYCRPYVDRNLNGFSDKPSTSGIPYKTTAHTGTGEFLTDYGSDVYSWFNYWIATGTSKGGTSPYFNGASWIATANNDKGTATGTEYIKTLNNDAITFTIDRGATVWVAMQAASNNFINNGWSFNNDGYKIYQGDGTAFTVLYSKHFDQGAVNIPTAGLNLNRTYMPLIIWDAPQGLDNTDLTAISYKLQGEDSCREIAGVVPGVEAYEIPISQGTDPEGIPEIIATPADSKSEVRVDYPSSVPGTQAIITVLSVSGARQQYTVSFTAD